jgi:hypothetical protein
MPILRKAVVQRDDVIGIPLPDPDLTRQGIVEAMLNSGRWVVRCPDDPKGRHFGKVELGDTDFVCPICYPDMLATALKPLRDDLLMIVPDTIARQAAHDAADADGKVYSILFPEDPQTILDKVEQRPTEAMNWLPGETMDFLDAENIEHGIVPPAPQVTVSGGE